jgi:hypothetical protein
MVAVKKRAFEEISRSVPRIGFSPAMVTARAFTGTDPFRSRRRGLLCGVTRLLQLRVFCLGFFQDWDVGVRTLPEREEVVVGSAGFGRVAGHCISSAELKVGKSTYG